MSKEDPQTSKELLSALHAQAKELFDGDDIVSFALIAVTSNDEPLLTCASTALGSQLALLGALKAAELDIIDTITAVDDDEGLDS